MRKLILAAVFLFAVLFLVTRTADIAQVAETFRRGAPHWLLLAIAVHLVSILSNGAVLRALYRALGLKEGVIRLAMVWCSAAFFTTVTSSGGWGGMAVFVADGRKRGLPAARVTVASAMYYLYDFVTALLVVGVGLIVLIRRGQLDPGEVLATAVLAVYAMILAAWLILAWRSPERLGRVLTSGGSFINRVVRPFVRRDYLDLVRARTLAHEMGAGVKDLRKSPEGLILPIALSLSQKALTIAILFLCFLAFSQPFSVGTLIAGYSLGILFTIVTPTPAGIGVTMVKRIPRLYPAIRVPTEKGWEKARKQRNRMAMVSAFWLSDRAMGRIRPSGDWRRSFTPAPMSWARARARTRSRESGRTEGRQTQ